MKGFMAKTFIAEVTFNDIVTQVWEKNQTYPHQTLQQHRL